MLKLQKNWFWRVATFGELATPQNVFLEGKIDKKCRNSVTAYGRGMIYGSKFAESSCFYMC